MFSGNCILFRRKGDIHAHCTLHVKSVQFSWHCCENFSLVTSQSSNSLFYAHIKNDAKGSIIINQIPSWQLLTQRILHAHTSICIEIDLSTALPDSVQMISVCFSHIYACFLWFLVSYGINVCGIRKEWFHSITYQIELQFVRIRLIVQKLYANGKQRLQ